MDEATANSKASPKDEAKVEEKKDVKLEAGQDQSKANTTTTTTAADGKKSGKKACKKHAKLHKKSRARKSGKEADSDSEEDSSSDSSDSESESENSDSSSDSSPDEEESSKKKKKKAKRKLKLKKSSKKSKRAVVSSDEDSEEDSSSSEEEVRSRRKSKKSKRSRRVEESDEESDEDDSSDTQSVDLRTQLRRLALTQPRGIRTVRRSNTGRTVVEKGKKKRKSKRSKKSSSSDKPQYFRADELWDREIHAYKLTETAAGAGEDEYGEYIFHVRRRFDWEGKYSDTVVDIKSKSLKNSLQSVMGSCKAISLAEDTPSIDPNMLFLYLDDIRKQYKDTKARITTEKKKKAKKAAAQEAAQLKCLLKYINKDYASTKKTLYPLLEAGNITFDLLWTLFRSETIIFTSTYSAPDEPRAFKVEYATKECSFMKGTWYEVEGRYLDFDGKSFGLGTMEVEIDSFKGPRKITSLPCYPIKYHKDAEAVQKKLVERGRKFTTLAGMKYKSHLGLGFMKRKRQVIKVSVNSRVMLDPSTFRRINPNYPISTIKPEDPDLLEEDRDSEDDCSCCGDGEEGGRPREPLEDEDKDAPTTRLKLVVDKEDNPHVVEVEVDEDGQEIQKECIEELAADNNNDNDDAAAGLKKDFSEEEFLIASPVVLGFAFSEKLWLEFTVSGVQEIEWNEGAFDSLVLPENQKAIVKALVQSHTSEAQERKTIDDVIKGKGKGLVAVLHGTPGVGKTLTAEGIAELLRCPLYSVSAGELGTNPRELEQELTKILDVAHSWGAVLLLDEADVFLEARTAQDIHRNALVSIFLRVLEYFQGILFLTTNRVSTFDDAFQSRIHIALRYQELDFKARRAIFKMFLDKVSAISGIPTTSSSLPSAAAAAAAAAASAASAAATSAAATSAAATAAETTSTETPSSSSPPTSTTPASLPTTPLQPLAKPTTTHKPTPTSPALATIAPSFSDADLDRLARRGALNGRQIKNAVRSAQALAVNERVPLGMSHVLKVLEVAEAFERDLKGGSGYLDAMRSYT